MTNDEAKELIRRLSGRVLPGAANALCYKVATRTNKTDLIRVAQAAGCDYVEDPEDKLQLMVTGTVEQLHEVLEALATLERSSNGS